MFFIAFTATILIILTVAVLANIQKGKALRIAPKGSTRIEAIKAQSVNRTVAQYQRAGWRVADQTTAKSFGSQARVTITFRKTAA